jgi:transporter family-2 protein
MVTKESFREGCVLVQRREYPYVEQIVYIAIAVGAGAINALQLAMIGGLTRERGGFESTFISMLASIGGLALLMCGMLIIGKNTVLPAFFRTPWPFALLAAVMFGLLIMAAAGVPEYYMLTGLTSIPYLLAAAFVGPRLGLGVYFAAIITGQMSGSLVVDQVGAFGGDIRPIDISRIIGVVLLVLGVALIRGR